MGEEYSQELNALWDFWENDEGRKQMLVSIQKYEPSMIHKLYEDNLLRIEEKKSKRLAEAKQRSWENRKRALRSSWSWRDWNELCRLLDYKCDNRGMGYEFRVDAQERSLILAALRLFKSDVESRVEVFYKQFPKDDEEDEEEDEDEEDEDEEDEDEEDEEDEDEEDEDEDEEDEEDDIKDMSEDDEEEDIKDMSEDDE
tara:strand:- start:53 stop:649 length:597 start_codon:yes stop_codon:yes gene_type:complete